MNFMWLDLSLMIVFVIGVAIFLITRKKNLKREGLLYLYRSEWGIKLIDKIGKKHKRLLKISSHISVWLGHVLMIVMLWLVGRIIWIYLFNADIVQAIKIPPITPLIPYLPQIFNLDFLPPFYFIYWIIIIAIIAISHEFFHGIFAAFNKIKIKKTGFGFFPFFLPIFLAAFVEPDEKQMQSKSNFAQRTVLSAGTFANILTAIIGLFLVAGFFALSFAPTGIVFDDYAYNIAETSEITMINNISLQNPTYEEISSLINLTGENEIIIDNEIYYSLRGSSADGKYVALYYDSPAINAEIYGPIIRINNQEVSSLEEFSQELNKYSVGQKITISTEINKQEIDYQIILQEKPGEPNSPWIGISFFQQSTGVMAKIFLATSFYKDPHTFYSEKYQGAQFIYDLLWWLVLISFSVALVNMLPMGIFDGGRFFYLSILKLTRSEKMAKVSFKFMTYLLLFVVVLVMFYWAKSFF